ncbi:DUF551 domain-containing protein [Bacteroides gallinarum]|uniref:DUF551 domain-containing protein n=1 Tax=Bacteroides gallinarum TaxID=376806 RepID=UPI00039B1DC4|nr:DUF551 domain-containing protein [Bacteroides gallinarum]
MKQTLEEAAKGFTKSVIDSFGTNGVPNSISAIKGMIALGFKSGAEWHARQSPWISVEERLPENTGWVFVAGGCYKYRVLFYCGGKFYTGEDLTTYDGGVLFWMPIPSFDEILEANKDVLERIKEKGD